MQRGQLFPKGARCNKRQSDRTLIVISDESIRYFRDMERGITLAILHRLVREPALLQP